MGEKKYPIKSNLYKMLIPTLEALKQLGGSGSIEEISREKRLKKLQEMVRHQLT